MIVELLGIPERRTTIVPELVRFFGDQHDELLRFIRTFGGASFDIPGPEFLIELRRDAAIFRELEADLSAESRLRLLRTHKICYSYLTNIYRVCAKRNLLAPPSKSRGEAVTEASAWMKRFPSLMNDVAEMYVLNAGERAQAIHQAGGVPRPVPKLEDEPELSPAQRKIVRTLKRAQRSMMPDEFRYRVHPRTVGVLVARGFVTELKTGRLKLTTKGSHVV